VHPNTKPAAIDFEHTKGALKGKAWKGIYRLTPELREWALRQATEKEIVAGLKEVREKGGTELGELIHDLEQGLQDCEHRYHP
jgi:hypothetical protein